MATDTTLRSAFNDAVDSIDKDPSHRPKAQKCDAVRRLWWNTYKTQGENLGAPMATKGAVKKALCGLREYYEALQPGLEDS